MDAPTAGQQLVATLNNSLNEGVEWTDQENVVLGLIEQAGNRLAALREVFDIEIAKTPVSTRRVTEVSGEIRQTEVNISRWSSSLDPGMERVKSAQHVAAANKRWHPASG